MIVTLTDSEIAVCLSLDPKRSAYTGARLSVAKALNLYPCLEETPPPIDLIGRTRAPIVVIYHPVERTSYSLVENGLFHGRPCVYVVVLGQIPDYEIVGYFDTSKLMPRSGSGITAVLHQSLKPMDTFAFVEILDNSRDIMRTDIR
jgi:hypothetical protein